MGIVLNDVREKVKGVYEEWFNQYLQISDKSRSEWMKRLGPGSTIPEDGRIYGEYWQNEFSKTTSESQAKAIEILDKERKAVMEIMAEAPSYEAMNVVNLLKMRAPKEKLENGDAKEALANEIDVFMTAYPNYSVYETLKDIAVKAGILDFKEHEVKKIILTLDELEKYITRYITNSAILNGVKDFDRNAFLFALESAGSDSLANLSTFDELPTNSPVAE